MKSNKKNNFYNEDVIHFLTKKIFLLNKFIKKILENEYFFNFVFNYFGEDTKDDFIKLIGDWTFQSIKWVCDIFKLGLVDRNKNDSLNCLLNFMMYDKEHIDEYYLKNGILAKDIINEENMKEKKIFEIMNEIQKQKIVEMMYYMAKINRNYLEETFDENFLKELNKETNVIINDLEFDEG